MSSRFSRVFLLSTLFYVGAAQAATGDELVHARSGTSYVSEMTGYPGPISGPRYGTGYEARHGLVGSTPGDRVAPAERPERVERIERANRIERIERGRGH